MVDAVSHPSAGAPVGVVYLEVRNPGKQDDRLVSVSSPAASSAMLHETVRDGDMARMKHASQGFKVPAGGNLKLAPGGKHVMLMGLVEPLVEGQTISLTLRFQQAGELSVEVPVRPRQP